MAGLKFKAKLFRKRLMAKEKQKLAAKPLAFTFLDDNNLEDNNHKQDDATWTSFEDSNNFFSPRKTSSSSFSEKQHLPKVYEVPTTNAWKTSTNGYNVKQTTDTNTISTTSNSSFSFNTTNNKNKSTTTSSAAIKKHQGGDEYVVEEVSSHDSSWNSRSLFDDDDDDDSDSEYTKFSIEEGSQFSELTNPPELRNSNNDNNNRKNSRSKNKSTRRGKQEERGRKRKRQDQEEFNLTELVMDALCFTCVSTDLCGPMDGTGVEVGIDGTILRPSKKRSLPKVIYHA